MIQTDHQKGGATVFWLPRFGVAMMRQVERDGWYYVELEGFGPSSSCCYSLLLPLAIMERRFWFVAKDVYPGPRQGTGGSYTLGSVGVYWLNENLNWVPIIRKEDT
jgi:hypothetical protein